MKGSEVVIGSAERSPQPQAGRDQSVLCSLEDVPELGLGAPRRAIPADLARGDEGFGGDHRANPLPRREAQDGAAVKTIGATVPEQLRSALQTERQALKLLQEGIATALDVHDQATREFLAGRLRDEEGHVDWLETQLSLIDSIGEAN
jgi:Ferritin-like domain